jgi:hypothetical protein
LFILTREFSAVPMDRRHNRAQSRYIQRSLIRINVKENSGGKICSYRLYIIVYMIEDKLFFIWDEKNAGYLRNYLCCNQAELCLK